MVMGGACVVNGSFLFMLSLSHLFGLVPVRFKRVGYGCHIELLKSSYYEYVYTGIINCLHFTNTFDTLIQPTFAGEIHVVSFVLRMLGIVELAMFLNYSILRSKKRLESLIGCVPINKRKNALRELRRFLLIAFFVLLRTGCILFPYFFSAKRIGSTAIILLGLLIQNTQSLIELSMSFIKFELQKYLETIKFELMEITADIKSDKKTKPPMSDISISLRALSKAFVSTCDIFFKYSKSENLLAVILSTMFTANLVRTVYNFAAACTSSDYEYKILHACCETAWLILHISRVILFVEASSQIGKEVDKIRYQVAQISELVTSVRKKMPSEAEIFQLVVLVNYPKLMPMGFFTVSRQLIGPILSTVATYAIVMVQIDSL